MNDVVPPRPVFCVEESGNLGYVILSLEKSWFLYNQLHSVAACRIVACTDYIYKGQVRVLPHSGGLTGTAS